MRRILLVAAAGVGLAAAGSAADPRMVSKPIDTTKYLIAPTDQAAGFLSGLTGTVTRTVGGSIENSGYARTINNLFGTKQTAPPTQLNGLPAPSLYPSTGYVNSFAPRMPTTSTYRK